MTDLSPDATSQLARTAYETLEPLHLVAYFNPYLRDEQRALGLRSSAMYVGARGGPLGECHQSVVTATFFNFSAETVGPAWQAARERGLEAVMATREKIVGRTLREAISDGEAVQVLAEALRPVAESVPTAGRPLAAAWAAQPWPDDPYLQLWHATTLLRESRGDGHIAVLVESGLTPLEALVFHESAHPDPRARKSTLGRQMSQASRGWSDEQWDATVAQLSGRGLLTADGSTYSPDGVALYDRIEAATDAASAQVWRDVPGASDLLASARPLVKQVIDAGIFP